jgi:4-hydroxybenzoate polyprenyltransferase
MPRSSVIPSGIRIVEGGKSRPECTRRALSFARENRFFILPAPARVTLPVSSGRPVTAAGSDTSPMHGGLCRMARHLDGRQIVSDGAIGGRVAARGSSPGVRAASQRSGLSALLQCIRYRDVLILQGAPLMGVAFSMQALTWQAIGNLVLFVISSFLLVAHIFTFNDWAGASTDRNDPNRSENVFSTKGVASRDVLLLSAFLLAVSLVLFAQLSRQTVLLALAIAALGVFYSHPRLNGKGTPIVSSCPHLIGGVLHFLLGYSLFSPIGQSSILIGLFFALTFTAGHLNQEVRDHDGDRLNAVHTNAVTFGKTRAFVAGLIVFSLAYADLFLLAAMGIVPAALALMPLVLYPIHVAWSIQTLRAGLSFTNVSRFQGRYRLLYGAMGLGIVLALLLRDSAR